VARRGKEWQANARKGKEWQGGQGRAKEGRELWEHMWHACVCVCMQALGHGNALYVATCFG
jgi:hypothetical protein